MRLRHGFTLLEYILYIGLSAAILVAMLRGSLLLIRTRDKLSTLQPIQEELRFTSRILTRTIRNAISINTSTSTFGSDNGVLSVTLSDPTVSPTIFTLQNGFILMQEGGGSPLALTSSKIIVEQMKFTNLTAGTTGTVKFNLRARPILAGEKLSLESSSSLRQ